MVVVYDFLNFYLLYEFEQDYINISVLFSGYSRHTFIKTGMQRST